MSTPRDDDAFRWEGDADPTLDAGGAEGETPAWADTASDEPIPDEAAGSEPARLPDGYTAVGKGSESVGTGGDEPPAETTATDENDHAEEPPTTGNAMLIALGVLGGVYALWVIGWIIGGLRLQGAAQYLVTDVMFQGSFWLAVLAPPIWFAATFVLTRGGRSWVRLAALIAGVVLLVPWPFVMIGTVGQ